MSGGVACNATVRSALQVMRNLLAGHVTAALQPISQCFMQQRLPCLVQYMAGWLDLTLLHAGGDSRGGAAAGGAAPGAVHRQRGHDRLGGAGGAHIAVNSSS